MSFDLSASGAYDTPVADDAFAGGPIPLSETTVTAFIGRTQRGPVNRAVQVRSFDEYRRIFGSHTPFSFLSYAVLHYFLCGGQTAVIVRVVNRGTRATLNLPAGEGALRLQARNPGSHELIRASVDYDDIQQPSPLFNLALQRVARAGSSIVEDQEIYRNLSMSPTDDNYVIDALGASDLVSVAGPLPTVRPDATRAKNPGEPIPYLRMGADGSDGDELTDYDLIGSNEEATGLFALEAVDRVSLICLPLGPNQPAIGITTLVATDRYCRQRHAMLILDPPWSWRSPESALLGTRRLGFSSDHAISYFPRVRSRESWERWPDGLPACGAVAGVLAGADFRARVGVVLGYEHALLRGGLGPQSEISDAQQGMLNRHGINVLRRVNEHAALLGDVTLAGDRSVIGAWGHLNHRRLALFVTDALERYTRWAAARAGDSAAVQKLNDQIRTFFMGLMARGALAASTPARAFFVRTEVSTQGALVITVGLALTKHSEFEIIEIRHDGHGCTTRTAHGFEIGAGAA
jgi:phage tail sheath protein FI